VQGLDADRRQGFGHIADTEPDDRLVGVGSGIGVYALGDIGKEVGSLELRVVFVDADHDVSGSAKNLNKPTG
jgi:hypothetical protein